MTHPHPLAEDEEALRARHDVVEERFTHAGCDLRLLRPEFSDRLINEESFDHDERLPYWAEVWPAARGLAKHLLDDPPGEPGILEIGSGLSLPSLALRSLGRDPVATDYEGDALRFARVNASRNGIGPLRTMEADWRTPPEELRPSPLLLGSDLLYETRNVEALASVLPRFIAPGGRALISDPGRVYLEDFIQRVGAWGSVRDRLLPPEEGSSGGIRLLEISRPA
jgi:predicted nicotinamide N-methyase